MALYIGIATDGLVKARRLSAHRQILHAIGLLPILYCGAGFFGSGFMAAGGSGMNVHMPGIRQSSPDDELVRMGEERMVFEGGDALR